MFLCAKEFIFASPSSIAFLKLQESALVIAKLFTPGIFEKMTMHEMRLLNAEASSMNDIYNVGEDIVLEQNYVGILLEGILKTKDQNMIASPGVLLPSNIHSNYGQNSSGTMNFDRLSNDFFKS